jgi:hypothetical protein
LALSRHFFIYGQSDGSGIFLSDEHGYPRTQIFQPQKQFGFEMLC